MVCKKASPHFGQLAGKVCKEGANNLVAIAKHVATESGDVAVRLTG